MVASCIWLPLASSTVLHLRHIYTSIFPGYLATRDNNKILCTPPSHIISSEEKLPRLTRRTRVQLRTNKSHFLKSYLHNVDAKSYPAPLCPFCNTPTHYTQHIFNFTHIRTTFVTPWNCGQTPLKWRRTAGQMDGKAGWWPSRGNIGLPHGTREWVDHNNTNNWR